MSSKVLLGSAAAVATGYILYERSLQQKQQQGHLAYPHRHENDKFEKLGGDAGSKVDNLATTAEDKLSTWKSSADEKLTSKMSELEKTKSQGVGWIGDKLGQAQDFVQDKQDVYLERSAALHAQVEEAREENRPNKLVQLAQGAKNHVSEDLKNIKQGVLDDVGSIKTAIVGTGENAKETVEYHVTDAKNKASDQVEAAKNSVSDAAATASDKVNDATASAKSTSESIFNWGFNKAEKAKAVAIGEYDKANKRYNEVLEDFNNSKKGVFSSGDSELKKKVDEAKSQLDGYKKKLDEVSSEYSKYASDNFNELSNKLDQQDQEIRRKGFLNWVTGSEGQTGEQDVDRVATRSVTGWGETAEQLAREELEELVRNKQIGPSEAQKRLNELRKIKDEGWFTYKGRDDEKLAARAAKALEGWGETASQLAQEEYEELRRSGSSYGRDGSDLVAQTKDAGSQAVDAAKKKLDEAKKKLDESGSSWWNFGKEKKDELNQEAKRQYEQAEKEYNSATEALAQWKDKAAGKFWSSADDALHTTKGGLDTLHSKTKEGLNSAQSYVKDKKEDSK